LAVLELIRLKQIVALQQEEFGEIEIAKAAEAGQNVSLEVGRDPRVEPPVSQEPITTNS